MEALQGIAVELRSGDILISWNFKIGFRHFYLHPDARDYFLFRSAGRYRSCTALHIWVGEIGVLVLQGPAAAGEVYAGRTGFPRASLY